MSIFPGHAGSVSSETSSRYVVPTAADRALFANLAHRKGHGGCRVGRVSPLDDGTYELVISGPGMNGTYYVDRETLRRLSDGSMAFSEVVTIDRDAAAQFGANRLPAQARHRIARKMAARRSHLSADSGSDRPEHAPAAAWKHGYEMAMAGAAQPQGSASLVAGYQAGLAAKSQAGEAVRYGAGALDSAWADITRATVDSAGASLKCPSSLPKTTDYSRCTCAQLAGKKKYWQDKEWATPLGSSSRKAYGARVNAIAMFEATCDQQSKGCGKGVETTDYSKLDCGCLEAKRRYWVDAASKQAVLSGKRELYEARANHIASFKDSCGNNKASSSSGGSSGTTSATYTPSGGSSSTTSSTPAYAPPGGWVAPSVIVPGSVSSGVFSAEQYAESAGISALQALDSYAAGDYVTARQHGVSAKAMLDQSVAVGRPFTAGPKVRCAVEWVQTGIMGAGCIGSARPAARVTYAPVLSPGVQVSGPIYSRPAPARPVVTRPAMSRATPHVPPMARPASPRLVRPLAGPLAARPAIMNPVARSGFSFRGLDAPDLFGGLEEDLFGLDAEESAFGLDAEEDLFGGLDEALFAEPYGLFDEDGV